MIRIPRFFIPTLVLVFSLVGTAHAQGFEILSGQKISTAIETEDGFQAFRFEAGAGDLLKLTIVAPKKGGLQPRVALLGPAGEVALPAVAKGKLKVRKLPLPDTGGYQIVVSGDGTTGPFKLSLKLKSPKISPGTVSVPGTWVFEASRGASISATIQAAKGTDLEPGVDSVIDPVGTDLLVPGALTEKGRTAKIKDLACSATGTHRMSFAVRGGVAGNAVVKLKVKLPKPETKKLEPEDLLDTGLLKVREGASEFGLTAWVEGDGIQGVRLVNPDGSEIPMEEDDGDFYLEREFATEVALDAAFPDGRYEILVSLDAGGSRAFPVVISGPYPGPVVITDPGTGEAPTVEWTGGAGAQSFYLGVHDPITEEDIYSRLLPDTTVSHEIPDDILDGLPAHEVEVVAISGGHKATATLEGAGGGPLDITFSKGMLYRVIRQAVGGSGTRAYRLLTWFEGTGIRSVALRFPASAGRPDEPILYDDGEWIYEENAADLSGFPDGTYTFVVTPFEGAEDLSRSFVVGGAFPEDVQGVWPQMGALVFGPEDPFSWSIPSDSDLYGMHLQVRDDTETVVVDQGFMVDNGFYAPAAGVLQPNRWYTAFLTRSNTQAKTAMAYTAFYTGSSGNLWMGVEKVRDRRGSGGAVSFFMEVVVESFEVQSVTLLDPMENEHPLKKDGDEFLLETAFSTEAELDAAFPDGLYSLIVTLKSGETTELLEFFVGGPWPGFADMVTPADGATGVSRTPTVTIAHSDKSNVAGAGIELWSEAKDDDYASVYMSSTDIVSVIWDDFSWKNVDQLPGKTKTDVELVTLNGRGKISILLTSFTTE